MNVDHTISSELQNVAPELVKLPRVNVYTVPDNYFINATEEILQKIDQSYIFGSMQKIPYAIPAGYFQYLAANILSAIKDEGSLKEISPDAELDDTPVLQSLSKEPVFKVPLNYFEDLLPSEHLFQPPIKIISFPSFNKFIRYAVAAVVTGLLAIATINLFFDSKEATSSPVAGKTYALPGLDSRKLQQLSEEDIAEFLTTQNISSDPATITSPDVDIKGSLQQLPDNEIDKYLNENPVPGEANTDG